MYIFMYKFLCFFYISCQKTNKNFLFPRKKDNRQKTTYRKRDNSSKQQKATKSITNFLCFNVFLCIVKYF